MNRAINLFLFDKELFKTSNLNLSEKVFFIVNKYFAVGLNKRKIKYLGKKFCYDGRYAPVALQMYPREIDFLDQSIDLKKIETVFDIGANIGQFSFTLKSFFPDLKVFSFEPNREIFGLLKKNLSYFKNVKLYNYGVGEKGQRNFYYSPSSSGLGSFYPENVNVFGRKKDVKEIRVNILEINNEFMKKNKIPRKIDLIKIDVEGAEMEVLNSLTGIDCKYIFLEVSSNRKGKEKIQKIVKRLEKVFGRKVEIIASKRLAKKTPSFDCIFKLTPQQE